MPDWHNAKNKLIPAIAGALGVSDLCQLATIKLNIVDNLSPNAPSELRLPQIFLCGLALIPGTIRHTHFPVTTTSSQPFTEAMDATMKSTRLTARLESSVSEETHIAQRKAQNFHFDYRLSAQFSDSTYCKQLTKRIVVATLT